MKRTTKFLVLASVLFTLAYLVGIAFNVSPWLRGPDEWRWAYALPGTLERLWLPAVLLVLYVLVAGWLRRGTSTRRRVVMAMLLAAAMTPALQLALLFMDHPDVRSPLFYRTVSESSGGFFNVGAPVTDAGDLLTHFLERMPGYPVHPQRHPPGLPLLFALTRQLFDRVPDLAGTVADSLRCYQCHNLALMNLPDSAIASATLQMAVPFMLGLVVIPLYWLGKRTFDRDTAVAATLLWPLLPSVALWTTRWNQLYALLTVLAYLSFHAGLTRCRQGWLFVSGAIVALGCFFGFGNLGIAGFLGIYALCWFYLNRPRPGILWLATGAGIFLVGFGMPWLVLWLAYGVNMIAIWRQAMGTHLGLGRNYASWLFFHLYDLFVFFGIALFFPLMARVVAAGRRIRTPRPGDVMTLAFVVGLLLLDISGTSQGEVARVWAFLLPLPLLIAVNYIPPRSCLFTGMAALLALQVFVSNIFLRPVGTGLSDPPPPPPPAESAPATGDALANWDGGITLLSAQLPASASAGQELVVTTTWTTDQVINRPYTIFVHLLNSNGDLVAQDDGLPLDGGWLTTCWQPGYKFEDRFVLALPDPAEGVYQARIGFYLQSSGERLPLQGDDATSDHSVALGSIDVEP